MKQIVSGILIAVLFTIENCGIPTLPEREHQLSCIARDIHKTHQLGELQIQRNKLLQSCFGIDETTIPATKLAGIGDSQNPCELFDPIKNQIIALWRIRLYQPTQISKEDKQIALRHFLDSL